MNLGVFYTSIECIIMYDIHLSESFNSCLMGRLTTVGRGCVIFNPPQGASLFKLLKDDSAM
jgi:hypothetical protein